MLHDQNINAEVVARIIRSAICDIIFFFVILQAINSKGNHFYRIIIIAIFVGCYNTKLIIIDLQINYIKFAARLSYLI